MENTVKQRLMQFCKATGIRPAHIEQKCGFSHGYINSLKDRPSTEKAERILSAYPQLNRVWLLSGEGSMRLALPSRLSALYYSARNAILVTCSTTRTCRLYMSPP